MGKVKTETCERCGIDFPVQSLGKHRRFCDGKWPSGNKLWGMNYRRKKQGLSPLSSSPGEYDLSMKEKQQMDKITSRLLDEREEITVNYCPCCGADLMKIRRLLLGKIRK